VDGVLVYWRIGELGTVEVNPEGAPPGLENWRIGELGTVIGEPRRGPFGVGNFDCEQKRLFHDFVNITVKNRHKLCYFHGFSCFIQTTY
jgi:hypothetical protein